MKSIEQVADMTAEEFWTGGMFTLDFLSQEERETIIKGTELFAQGKVRAYREWISVEDCWPPNDGWCNDAVLFVCDNGIVHAGCYDYEFGDWTKTGGGVYKNATHWMPLPELPIKK